MRLKVSRAFVIFCCIGVFNTLLNYAVFLLFLKYLHWHYVVSGGSGFLAGAFTGFILNRKLTFNSSVSIADGLTTYLVLQIFCLGLHSSVQLLAVLLIHAPQTWSQLPGIVVTTFVNYNLSKRFVFKLKGGVG